VSTKDCFVKRVNIIIEYIRLFKTFSWSFWWLIGIVCGFFITGFFFGIIYEPPEISLIEIWRLLRNFIERITTLHVRLKEKFGVVRYVFITIVFVFLLVFFLWFFLLLQSV
jgi:hypothetical protein